MEDLTGMAVVELGVILLEQFEQGRSVRSNQHGLQPWLVVVQVTASRPEGCCLDVAEEALHDKKDLGG
jgi:hypothetical protein